MSSHEEWYKFILKVVERIDNKISDLYAKIDNVLNTSIKRTDDLENKLDEKYKDVDVKIEKLRDRLDTKIDNLSSKISSVEKDGIKEQTKHQITIDRLSTKQKLAICIIVFIIPIAVSIAMKIWF